MPVDPSHLDLDRCREKHRCTYTYNLYRVFALHAQILFYSRIGAVIADNVTRSC